MNYIEAIILAIIEGITEFLPVSSTGHMIVASSFFGIAHEDFTKLFTIVIQLGTIMSVIVLYFKRFFQSLDFYFKLLVAFIPAVVLGLLFSDAIDDLLENPITVAVSLIIGGVLLLKVDDWFGNEEGSRNIVLNSFKNWLFSMSCHDSRGFKKWREYCWWYDPKIITYRRCRIFVFLSSSNHAWCHR